MFQASDYKEIEFKKINPAAILPTRAHEGDAGLDLYSDEALTLQPGEGRVVKTGISMALESGFVGMIADRSSMGKRGIKVTGGIIDAGYRGEIGVILWNWSKDKVEFQTGDRIAQLLIIPVATPTPILREEIRETSRGSGGFGSSGR